MKAIESPLTVWTPRRWLRPVFEVGLSSSLLVYVSACGGLNGDPSPGAAELEVPDLIDGSEPIASGMESALASGGRPGEATDGAQGSLEPATAETMAPIAGDGPIPETADGPFEPAHGMLRRLTRAQFHNALRDVLGSDVVKGQLDADSWNGDFATIGAATVVTSERGAEQYNTAIETAVDAVFDDAELSAGLVGCTPTADDSDECTRAFITRLGRRVWRRPLTVEELERLTAVAHGASETFGSPLNGLRWATVALLQSPSFLYRPELGRPNETGRFTGYEMASRLAFLLWNSLPDEALLNEAESGTLDSPDGVYAAAERMLSDSRGREAVGAFAEEFMRLDRLTTQAKDTALYPEYGTALQTAMVRDMRQVWETIAADEQASAFELFTTPKVVVNEELALLYGLDATGLSSDTFEERLLPVDSPRIGILGKSGFLSQFANQKEGSPTLRGKFIRHALLCTDIPAPPGDVDLVLDEPPESMPMTKRDRLQLHRADPSCAGCHSLMDPLGLPFETFDAIGRFRQTELGLKIDPSGEFEGQAVADSRAFAFAIDSSEAVARCLVRKYYSYAMGYEPRPQDAATLEALVTAFRESGFSLRDLVLNVATNEAFVSVSPQLEAGANQP